MENWLVSITTFPDNYGLIVVRMVTYNLCMINFTNVMIFNTILYLKNFLKPVMIID